MLSFQQLAVVGVEWGGIHADFCFIEVCLDNIVKV